MWGNMIFLWIWLILLIIHPFFLQMTSIHSSLWLYNSIMYRCHHFFIHSSIDGHLDWFHNLGSL
jgi:hypothetical protein